MGPGMDKSNIAFFVASKPEKFEWPVKVPVPGDGKYDYVEFTGVFKYQDETQTKAWLDADKARTDKQLLADVLLAVKDLKTVDGQAVASTPELVASVIEVDRVAPVAMGTYLAALRGLAAEKN
jgi:hypothetical protein